MDLMCYREVLLVSYKSHVGESACAVACIAIGTRIEIRRKNFDARITAPQIIQSASQHFKVLHRNLIKQLHEISITCMSSSQNLDFIFRFRCSVPAQLFVAKYVKSMYINIMPAHVLTLSNLSHFWEFTILSNPIGVEGKAHPGVVLR